VMIKEDIAE